MIDELHEIHGDDSKYNYYNIDRYVKLRYKKRAQFDKYLIEKGELLSPLFKLIVKLLKKYKYLSKFTSWGETSDIMTFDSTYDELL